MYMYVMHISYNIFFSQNFPNPWDAPDEIFSKHLEQYKKLNINLCTYIFQMRVLYLIIKKLTFLTPTPLPGMPLNYMTKLTLLSLNIKELKLETKLTIKL